MKYLILLVLFISACCNRGVIQMPPVEKPVVIEDTRPNKERDAWLFIENEELISIFENSNVKAWYFIGDVVITRTQYIEKFWDKKVASYYDKVAIFNDGSLYLDGSKRELISIQQNRLTSFYNKVKGK
jgi:predicted small lipoprotein YifL